MKETKRKMKKKEYASIPIKREEKKKNALSSTFKVAV